MTGANVRIWSPALSAATAFQSVAHRDPPSSARRLQRSSGRARLSATRSRRCSLRWKPRPMQTTSAGSNRGATDIALVLRKGREGDQGPRAELPAPRIGQPGDQVDQRGRDREEGGDGGEERPADHLLAHLEAGEALVLLGVTLALGPL